MTFKDMNNQPTGAMPTLPTEGFFTFFNIKVPYTTFEGEYYVPVKPICDAIGLNHNSAYKGIKNEDSLSELCKLMPQLGSDEKRYEMLSLPWWTIHGWLYSVDSSRVNVEARTTLKKYKLICHKIVHDFFVGSAEFMSKRKVLYVEIAQVKQQIVDVETKLSENEDYQTLLSLKKVHNIKRKEFQALDEEEFGSEQLQLAI